MARDSHKCKWIVRVITRDRASSGQMKPEGKIDRLLVEALLAGGYLPTYDLSLKLGREIQDTWMQSYQEVLITNTFKVVLKRKLLES